jgi:hypothetical protein
VSPDVRRGGPGQETASATLASTSVPPSDFDALDELAAVVGGTFVLVVELAGGRHRRRCFLTAAAAEKAAHRALLAGHNAQVYLAELKPLWLLKGSEVTE